MQPNELIQGTEEWRRARAGSLGASQIAEMMARTKNGYGASRANLMAQLLVERLTGQPTNGFVSAAMQFGIDNEPQARLNYEMHIDREVKTVGLIPHPVISGCHASPDGLVGDDGLVEIKVPMPATHLNTLLTKQVDDRYIKQMAFQMACSGRAWCDFVSFQPTFPPHLQLFVTRINRDDVLIAELEKEARIFLGELDAKLAQLTAIYERAAA